MCQIKLQVLERFHSAYNAYKNFVHNMERERSVDTIKLFEVYPLPVSLSTCLTLSSSLSMFEDFLKRGGCLLNHHFQRVSFLFCQLQIIFTPWLHLPEPPPVHPFLSKRTLANLYSLSHAKHLSCPH